VATISRLLKITGLFCRISSLLKGSFAKETYYLKEPTNRSHPITKICNMHICLLYARQICTHFHTANVCLCVCVHTWHIHSHHVHTHDIYIFITCVCISYNIRTHIVCVYMLWRVCVCYVCVYAYIHTNRLSVIHVVNMCLCVYVLSCVYMYIYISNIYKNLYML